MQRRLSNVHDASPAGLSHPCRTKCPFLGDYPVVDTSSCWHLDNLKRHVAGDSGEGFALGHFGTGSAVAVVLFLILLVFSIVYVRLIGKEAQA